MRFAAIIVVLSCASVGRAEYITWDTGEGITGAHITDFDGHVYMGWKVPGGATWQKAREHAETLIPPPGFGKGHLATFTGRQDMDWCWIMAPPGFYPFIGFHYEGGLWKWVDGSPIVNNWPWPATKAPSGLTVDYTVGVAYYSSERFFNDGVTPYIPYITTTTPTSVHTAVYNHYIMEFEPLPVPEPSTFVLAGIAAVGLGWRWRRSRT